MTKYSYKNKLETEFEKWIAETDVNVAITYTFKQGIPLENGMFENISDEEIVRTMWILRDRTTKKILGTNKFKAGHRLPFIVFKEGDGKIIRHHVHIAARKPLDMTLHQFRSIHLECSKKLRWIYGSTHFNPIYDQNGWISYCSSHDLKSYIPQASEHRFF